MAIGRTDSRRSQMLETAGIARASQRWRRAWTSQVIGPELNLTQFAATVFHQGRYCAQFNRDASTLPA